MNYPIHNLNVIETLRDEIVGIAQQVPLLNGSSRPYVYLDNAASTPAFRSVQEKVNRLLNWYSSVHRGAGFKSLVASRAYERSHEIVASFLGADPEADCVIFGKNTTEAINSLASTITWEPGDVVVTTLMEHHSNDLPWRGKAQIIYTGVDAQGALDLDELETTLQAYAGKVKLVAVSGASNVTGFVQPVHAIAELAHRVGALTLVDAAQLAPHRPIDMGPHGSPSHLDFVAISGHKMYAPFGTGALLGPKEFFRRYPPPQRGGGTIEVVTLHEVHWADPPERFEAGSPNVLGAVALAASVQVLSQVGMAAISEHEKELTSYTLKKFQELPQVKVYGSADPNRLEDRLGVISFDIAGVSHAKVAAILAFEGGIGVRNGCFCAHPYILHLLGVEGEVYEHFKTEVMAHNRRHVPGLVRVSYGCYNKLDEIDHLVEMLRRIITGDYQGDYVQEASSGSFYPRGFNPDLLSSYYEV